MSYVTKTLGAMTLCLSMLSFTHAHAQGELTGTSFYVAVDPSNPPFSTLSGDYVTPFGIDVDIIKELQKRLGFKLIDDRIFPLLRNDQVNRIKAFRIDIIGGALSVTQERKDFLDYSAVYFDTGITMIYSKNKYSKVKDINTFAKSKVAAVEGTTAIQFLQKTLPNAQIVTVPSFMVGIVDVSNGLVDAMVYDRPVIEYFAQSMPSFNLEIMDKEYSKEFCQYALGMQKHSPYSFFITRELEEMKRDGTLAKIIGKYIK